MTNLISSFGLERLPYGQRDKKLVDLVGLNGLGAIVTGGGGPNLGQALVHRLAGCGARVVVVDRDKDLAVSVAQEAAQKWDAETLAIGKDTTDWDQVEEVVGMATEFLGSIDILVNNVGGGAGGFVSMSHEDIDQTISTTLLSTLYCSHAVLPQMVDAAHGRIINISSEGGSMAQPNITLYNSCKSAIDGFTRNLASEVGPLGVGVVGVAPGLMLGDGLVYSLRHPQGFEDRIKSMRAAFDRISFGRGCLPEEVANVVAFLATEAGSYVHGTTVAVGGGLSS